MRNALTVAQDLLAVWTERDEIDMVEFQDIIARRADLLAELACWDLWSLPERERNKVFELLNAVRTRDAALIELLQEEMRNADKAMLELVNARRAARGYQNPSARRAGMILQSA